LPKKQNQQLVYMYLRKTNMSRIVWHMFVSYSINNVIISINEHIVECR